MSIRCVSLHHQTITDMKTLTNIEKLNQILSKMNVTALSVAFVQAKTISIRACVRMAMETLVGEDQSDLILDALK